MFSLTVPAANAAGSSSKVGVTSSSSASTGRIVLRWNAVKNAKEYKVYRTKSSGGEFKLLKTVAGTSATDSSAKAGSTYYYKVKAVSSKGKVMVTSDTVSCLCRCAAPVVTAGNKASSGKCTLKWTTVDGAVRYEVYRASSKNGTYNKVYTTEKTSYTNTSAKAGSAYYYKVKAIAKNNAADSAFSDTVKRTCDCARPVLTVSNNKTTGKIIVRWKAVDGAAKYEVYRASGKTGEYKLLKTVTGTSFTNTSVTAGNTYYYKVKAISPVTTAANSAFSETVKRTCDCAKMTVEWDWNKNGDPVFEWEKIAGATSYKVYRAKGENGSFKLLGETKTLSYTDTTAKVGVSYRYKFIAVSSKSGDADSAALTETALALPSQPKDLKITSAPKSDRTPFMSTYTASWSAVEGADGYYLLIGSSKKTEEMYVFKEITKGNSVKFSDNVPYPSATYYFAVVAYTELGDDTYLISRPSSPVKLTAYIQF